jgi:hypothetical protein
MLLDEKQSRERARALLATINSAVDGVMAGRGLDISEDPVAAVLNRAEFLEGFSGVRVHDRQLRAVYVHLEETLRDMGAEPLHLTSEYEVWATDFMVTLGTV